MFLSQALKPQNEFWKYIVGSVAVIGASFIGQIPFTIAALAAAMAKGGGIPDDPQEIMSALEPNLSLFLLLASFIPALLTLYLVVRYLHKQSWRSVTTGRKRIDWKRIFFSFGLWATFYTATTLAAYYAQPEDFVVNFQPGKFAILAVIAVVLIPVQTSTEEYIFRGYLMQGFATLVRYRWFPLVLTSIIFGVLHIANPEVDKLGYGMLIFYIGTGFFLGIITLMDDGMELALGFHAANNLTGALLVTADWTAFKTYSIFTDVSEPGIGFDILLPVLVIFPILLFIFSKVYRWSGWKEKLAGKIEPETQNHES
jgi:membrane protease YdiL (CAAX protease family)